MKLSWRGKLYKELLWKCATSTTIQKFDKRMEEMKNHNIEAYEWLRKIPPQHWARKWESSGIQCTHAVAAIQDMASNRTDTGIPESYCNPCHWLSTWKEMYMFKINPIGRPPKKRKKSAAELADEIMKSNKMTRLGNSVTCSLCKQVGHNQRGCKSKKIGDAGAGSQGGGDAGVGGSQNTQTTVRRGCKS
ncbi:hypothetical protein Tco_1411608 [Tanacetum coccineum]